jgi:hypothetical protein
MRPVFLILTWTVTERHDSRGRHPENRYGDRANVARTKTEVEHFVDDWNRVPPATPREPGKFGTGVFVLAIEEAVRIRTGERGLAAVERDASRTLALIENKND